MDKIPLTRAGTEEVGISNVFVRRSGELQMLIFCRTWQARRSPCAGGAEPIRMAISF